MEITTKQTLIPVTIMSLFAKSYGERAMARRVGGNNWPPLGRFISLVVAIAILMIPFGRISVIIWRHVLQDVFLDRFLIMSAE